MDHDPDHLYLWPGYFNIRTSRRSGRRVPKDASVLKPDLDGLALAARSAGIRRMQKQSGVAHPARPWAMEGRLKLSRADATERLGTGSKEEIMQLIGAVWKDQRKTEAEAEIARASRGPRSGDRQARSQRGGRRASARGGRRSGGRTGR